MGSSSHLFCINCGAANPQHARFCPVCGHALGLQNTGSISAAFPSVSISAKVPVPVTASETQLPSIQHVVLKQRYRLRKKVGSGGYGDVYQAVDSQFGDRLVAIKEMSQNGLSPQEISEASEAFKREAFMLAALTHPGLPSIYDYFADNDRWYLVMSFIEGETLESYLSRSKNGHLPADKVLYIGIQLASVLSYLHSRKPPIIFRDLKPSNVMRTYDGQIYLVDFGIARHFKPGQTKDTIALGSPGYAAPEQYGRAQTTPQTDVYSLGVMLHQMLSGFDPSDDPFNLPPLHIPEYPQLRTLISCTLEMDPKKRPASMGNIKRELQRISTRRSPLPAQRSRATKQIPSVSPNPMIDGKRPQDSIWVIPPYPPSSPDAR
ncbi:MAG TPA: serine/threonine-protein kinase [Ktedonobacteraceae bacterium]